MRIYNTHHSDILIVINVWIDKSKDILELLNILLHLSVKIE